MNGNILEVYINIVFFLIPITVQGGSRRTGAPACRLGTDPVGSFNNFHLHIQQAVGSKENEEND